MQKSKIGEGSVESGAVSVNERRTSSTVLLDPAVVEQHPQLQPMVLQLQSKAQQLLDIGMSNLHKKDAIMLLLGMAQEKHRVASASHGPVPVEKGLDGRRLGRGGGGVEGPAALPCTLFTDVGMLCHCTIQGPLRLATCSADVKY